MVISSTGSSAIGSTALPSACRGLDANASAAVPPSSHMRPSCASGGIEEDMATDKTGATTTVTKESDRFTISVDGTVAGFTEISDSDGRRTFPHTEVDDAFQG